MINKSPYDPVIPIERRTHKQILDSQQTRDVTNPNVHHWMNG
jgi:hypothetical protein